MPNGPWAESHFAQFPRATDGKPPHYKLAECHVGAADRSRFMKQHSWKNGIFEPPAMPNRVQLSIPASQFPPTRESLPSSIKIQQRFSSSDKQMPIRITMDSQTLFSDFKLSEHLRRVQQGRLCRPLYKTCPTTHPLHDWL